MEAVTRQRSSFDEWFARFLDPFDYSALKKHSEVYRPETVHHPVLQLDGVRKALDMGCGQGFTTVYLASKGIEVVAADILPDAVTITAENVKTAGVEDRVKVVSSDLFSNIQDRDFDTIICYPPQLNKPSRNTWMEIAANDPGQGFLKALLRQAGAYLNPSGPRLVQLLFSDPSLVPRPLFFEQFGYRGAGYVLIPLIPIETSEQSYFTLVGLEKDPMLECFSL